jgi:hypothetical protein
MKLTVKQLEFILTQHGFSIVEYFSDVKKNRYSLTNLRNWLGY